jgi:putative ABC transport system substrate-binding protein
MKRREFITLFGGAAIARPVNALSQGRTARIGALMVVAETDPDAKRLVGGFEARLSAGGWYRGRNIEIAYRWGASNPELLARYANELVLLEPDVLLVFGTPALISLRKATTTIPTVFTGVSDPVAQGFVASLAHPGGNATGFSNFELDVGSKWLQLLKEIAPSVTHVGVMFNPQTSPYNALWMRSIEAAAPAFNVSTVQSSIQTDMDINSTISTLAAKSGSGLIVPSDPFTYERAAMIASLATSNRLAAVYCLFQVRAWGRIDFIRHRSRRAAWESCCLRRPHSQGRETGRFAGTEPYQVRASDQSQDREGAWPRRTSDVAGAGRRGDRINWVLAALHMSVPGTKRTNRDACYFVRFRG